jgi:hypothetical protein
MKTSTQLSVQKPPPERASSAVGKLMLSQKSRTIDKLAPRLFMPTGDRMPESRKAVQYGCRGIDDVAIYQCV